MSWYWSHLQINIKTSIDSWSQIKNENETTGSFRMNENFYMLITKGCGALLKLKQVGKFH